MNLYLCYDKISNKIYDVFMADNDAVAIQRNLPQLSRFKRLNDFDIFCACQIDVENFEDILKSKNGFFGNQEYRLVDKNCYKFSEIEMEHISKTDAIRQIELYRKTQELQIKQLQAELDKIKQN